MNYRHTIAYLGQQRDKSLRNSPIISLTGFDNFNEDIVNQLRSLLDQGIIESAPELRNFEEGAVVWRSKDDVDHRPNNLPAKEWRDGVSVEYWVNGKPHRTNGPAIINNPRYIKWELNGVTLADNADPIDKYRIDIKNHFPGVDADYWAGEEYMGSIIPKDWPWRS